MIVFQCDWCRLQEHRCVPSDWRTISTEDKETDITVSELICNRCFSAYQELRSKRLAIGANKSV